MIEVNSCGKWFNNGDYKSLSNWIIKLKENNSLRKFDFQNFFNF